MTGEPVRNIHIYNFPHVAMCKNNQGNISKLNTKKAV